MELHFEHIIKNLHDGLYLTDRDRQITYWNPAAEAITGYRAEEVIGHSCADNILMHVDDQGRSLCKGLCPLAKTIQDGETRQATVFLRHKEGHRVPVSVRVTPLKDGQGEIIGGIELFADASEQQAREERLCKLEKLALLDSLTQLPNRRYLEAALESALNMYSRGGVPFGMLFMDIDHFKAFNDQQGHQLGDRVLRTTASTLAGAVRPFDTLGRWGGEEFLGIFPNTDLADLQEIGQRLLALLRTSRINYQGKHLTVTITIGGAGVRKSDNRQSITARADQAMYQGKDRGRDCLVILE